MEEQLTNGVPNRWSKGGENKMAWLFNREEYEHKKARQETIRKIQHLLHLSRGLEKLAQAESHKRWEQRKIDALLHQARGLAAV